MSETTALRAVPSIRLRRLRLQAEGGRGHLGLIALVLPLLLLLAIFVFTQLDARRRAIRETEAELADAARVFAEQAQATFQIYRSAALAVSLHLANQSWDEIAGSPASTRLAAALVAEFPVITDIAILNRDGFAVSTRFREKLEGKSFSSRDYFRALLDGDSVETIGKRRRSSTLNDDVLTFAVRRETLDGRFDGIIAVYTHPSTFVRFWSGSPRFRTALFRADGRLLARFPQPGESLLDARAAPATLDAMTRNDPAPFTATSTAGGDLRRIVVRRVEGFPLYIATSVAEADVLAAWRDELRHQSLVFVAGALLLLSTAIAVSRSLRAERLAHRALQRQTSRLERAETELAALLQDTLRRQESERTRISRELHDSLGQHLTIIHFGLDALQQESASAALHSDRLCSLKRTATAASQEISRLALELRPIGLGEFGLEHAIRAHVSSIANQTGLAFRLTLDSVRGIEPSVEDALFRIFQEALSNIVRHAGAATVSVALVGSDREVRLVVEDDGEGFVYHHERPPGSRVPFGLRGMQERVAMFGGRLRIESRPGAGTVIDAAIPLNAAAGLGV